MVIKGGKRSFLILLFLYLSCKPSPIRWVCKPLYREKPPPWIEKRPDDVGDTLYAVGIKTNSPTMEGGENDARMDAVRQIVERFFGMEVESKYKKFRVDFQTKVEEDLKGRGKGKIIGGKTEEVYYEKCEKVEEGGFKEYYNVYILYSASLSKMEELVRDIEKRRSEVVSKAKALLRTCPPRTQDEGVRFLQIAKELLPLLNTYRDDPEIAGLIKRIEECVENINKMMKTVKPMVNIEGGICGEGYAGAVKSLLEEVLRSRGFTVVEENGRLVCELKLNSVYQTGIFHIIRISGTITLKDTTNNAVIFSSPVEVNGAGANLSSACRSAVNNMREVLRRFNF